MLSDTCPRCGAGLGDGLDLRQSSCHACGYVDYSKADAEPEQVEEETVEEAGSDAPIRKKPASKKAS